MNKELLGESWYNQLKSELDKEYFQKLKEILKEEYSQYKVYPKPDEIFKAFKLTPFEKVRVVILGQDPYPFPDSRKNPHAHGLAFSSQSMETPASLRTILREVDRDVVKVETKKEFDEAFPNNDLTPWANQGVLLLNTSLTVRAGDPNSHKQLWSEFIEAVIRLLYQDESMKVFLIWGKEAQDVFFKCSGPPNYFHKAYGSGHPATASKGRDLFSGCNHFSKTNWWLERQGLKPIEWRLADTTKDTKV